LETRLFPEGEQKYMRYRLKEKGRKEHLKSTTLQNYSQNLALWMNLLIADYGIVKICKKQQ
jgi:hypothetical protein